MLTDDERDVGPAGVRRYRFLERFLGREQAEGNPRFYPPGAQTSAGGRAVGRAATSWAGPQAVPPVAVRA